MTITEFLTARYDEEEQAAIDAYGAPWEASVGGMVHVSSAAIRDNKLRFGRLGYVAGVEREADRQHIARHDPAHVLADIAAKRAIVRLHSETDGRDPSCSSIVYSEEAGDCETLRALAHPFADHPDYDPTWSMETQ